MIPIEETKRINGNAKYAEWLTDDGLLRIEGWARDGLTDTQIAHNIGVTERSFTDWKTRFSSISSALKKGKAPADIEVENALYKRAIGYDYEETVTEIYKGADGVERQHIRKIKKHLPPDPTSMIYWLKNRKPQFWRDGREVNIDVNSKSLNNTLLKALQGAAQEITDIPENTETGEQGETE